MLSWHIVCALQSGSKNHGKVFSAMFECLNLRQEAHIAAASSRRAPMARSGKGPLRHDLLA
jgi:hypothetical protein